MLKTPLGAAEPAVAAPPGADGRRYARAATITVVAAVFVIAVGLLVLAGWVLDVAFLKGPLPGLAQMKASAAIAFVPSGVALLLTVGEPSPGRRRAGCLLAGLAIAIGAVTLLEYLLGRGLGVDQLLVRDLDAVPPMLPGRMSPQAAIDFVAVGFALLLLNLSGGAIARRLVGVLAGSAFVVGVLALIGYCYGVTRLAGLPSLTPIALQAAVAFVVLCIGIAAGDSDGVFAEVLTGEGPGSVMARRLLPLAMLAVPVLGWLALLGQRGRLYQAPEGLAMLVLASMLVLALAILSLTRRLNRLDRERRRAAARLVRFAALVEAAHDAIVGADLDGTITTCNRAAEKLFGYNEQEIVGRSVSILAPAHRAEEQLRAMEAVAGAESTVEFDTQRVGKDGSLLDVAVALSPIMDGDELTGFCCVTRDIAVRVRAQNALEHLVRERTDELGSSREETLQKLALAAEYRDDDTAQHTQRVGAGAAALATGLGFPARFISLIAQAAPLHDIGKIAIPDHVLFKHGRLTDEEFEAMKQHTVLGARLLTASASDVLQLGEQIALTHHERWDGHGYPAGLAGEAIPIAGRIVAVVDAFDAMTNDRRYRPAGSVADALSEISRCKGRQFDPRVVDAFVQLHEHHASDDARRDPEVFDDTAASTPPRCAHPSARSAALTTSRVHPPRTCVAGPTTVPLAAKPDLEVALPRTVEAPRVARRCLRSLYADHLDGDLLADAELLVSELVNNGLRHGQGQITMRAHLDGERLMTEVIDEGPGLAHELRDNNFWQAGGWGLNLVDSISDRWGAHDQSPTHVWFELEIGDPAA